MFSPSSSALPSSDAKRMKLPSRRPAAIAMVQLLIRPTLAPSPLAAALCVLRPTGFVCAWEGPAISAASNGARKAMNRDPTITPLLLLSSILLFSFSLFRHRVATGTNRGCAYAGLFGHSSKPLQPLPCQSRTENTCFLVPSVGQCDVRRNSALGTQLLEYRRIVGFSESKCRDRITGFGRRLEHHPRPGDVAIPQEFKPALDHQLNLGRLDLARREKRRSQRAVMRPF